MSSSHADAPPSYDMATGSSSASRPSQTNRLEVPSARNGIPSQSRRSMEDETRPLPKGWVRQWDAKEKHQFFVDTKATPPRSIWHHPYDDEDFLKTLSSEERERIQEQERDVKRPQDAHLDTTDEEVSNPPSPRRPTLQDRKKSTGGFGRKMKDKLTGKTHEERELERKQRAEEERQYYEAHMKFRDAMQRAQMTGQPQLLGKDKDGKEVYVEPPQMGGGYGGYSGGYSNGYGYNPYAAGPYANPNARFVRPGYPYNRPYGGGYGGGMGMPIAGGLLGGMLLGGLLF